MYEIGSLCLCKIRRELTVLSKEMAMQAEVDDE